MRQAVGGSLLMNLVVIFTAIIVLFFVSIISYSKAYGVKNRIISIIEKYDNYNMYTASEIDADLKNIGYRSATSNKCDSQNIMNRVNSIAKGVTPVKLNNNYNYCLYRIGNQNDSHYYVIVTFVSFDFPLISNTVTFPVFVETKILG